MCGIAGVLNGQGAIRMAETIRHRGPDGIRNVVTEDIDLAHAHLKIVGDQRQPVTRTPYTLVYNGELYGIPGLDTDYLLDRYEAQGLNMFDSLNGMFAFAIWDHVTKRLVLARDRFGEKPLYFANDHAGFRFASEAKAVCANPMDARKVPAGHYITVQHGHVSAPVRYWELPEVARPWEPNDFRSLRELIQDAVHIRLRADADVGCYVSGGLDSAVVAAIADTDLCFTGRYDVKGYDESRFAELAAPADMWGVTITPEDLITALPQIMWHLDYPVAGPGVVGQWFVSELAAKHVRVVLGGQGGDEVFGGYARYARQAGVSLPEGYGDYETPSPYVALSPDNAQRHDLLNGPLEDLLHVEDRVSMAHGIESRCPLLDHRIAEFVMSREWPERYQHGLKTLLRQVAKDVGVHQDILERTDKAGFPVPLNLWAKGPLREFVEDTLGKPVPENLGEYDRSLWHNLSREIWAQVYFGKRADDVFESELPVAA